MQINNILNFYTTGKKTADGKLKVFVCYHEAEPELFVKYARAELMRYCDDSVLYYLDSTDLNRSVERQILSLIGEMDGVFICVTRRLLYDANCFARAVIDDAVRLGRPILPYFCEADLYDLWNSFMPIQAIDPFKTDSTQIKYDIKISNWVEKIRPLSEDIVEKIWSNFEYIFFLSYRKMDRQYVDTLMRNIHGQVTGNPLAFAGIWYDEALTSDENYNTIIANKIEESDIILMLITPNIFAPNDKGEDNYIISTEYPAFENKKIIGVVVPGTDVELAAEYFPAVQYFVSLEDADSIREAIFRVGLPDDRVRTKDADNEYYSGLAYLKGIGTEINIDNAAILLMHAVYLNEHEDALRRIIEIELDENEKLKGEDGYYDPGSAAENALKLYKKAYERAEADKNHVTVKAVHDELILLIRQLKVCGEKWVETALKLGMTHLSWNDDIIGNYADDEFTRSLRGETLIEIGELQYLRHVFRGYNIQGREPGAIAYLPEGIELFRLRPGEPTLKETDIIIHAYDCLADSYYRQGTFSNQCRTLEEKIAFVEKYAVNEMDGIQMLERSDTLFQLAEACMMGRQDMLNAALSYFGRVLDYIDRADGLCSDFQIVKRRIRLYIGIGNAFLCKMDISQNQLDRIEWKNSAYRQFDKAEKTAVAFLETDPKNTERAYVEYLLGRTYLKKHCANKIDNITDQALVKAASDRIIAYRGVCEDYDVLHDYYRVQMEIMNFNMRYVFIESETLNTELVYNMLEMLDNTINQIQDDVRQHNDYWLALDRLEFYITKTQLLVLAFKNGMRTQSVVNDIENNIYISESYIKHIVNKKDTDKSRVLLGSMYELCIISRDFYSMIGNERAMLEWIKTAGTVIDDVKKCALNDYMK